MSKHDSTVEKNINFMGQRFIAMVFSGLLLIASIGSLVVNGLQFGLDFTGGLQIEAEFAEKADLEKVRTILAESGFADASIVYFGAETEVMVRTQQELKKGVKEKILSALEASTDSGVTIKRIEFVGPQVGDELRDQGGIGMLFALAVVMAYVALRFQFKFSVAAVAALIHDVIIVLGIFSIFKFDFDLTVLAAVLAVIGYSLNDTIVVSDRIRENFRKLRTGSAVEIINTSLTQTLGRTLVTSLTTMLVLLALFFVGGELIHAFSIALIIGIVVGTYSSIYVAANVLLLMQITKEDLIVPVKEGAEFDDLP
ncbi:protein-export membrane protein SecF [Candidatus Endobugula sertula]|uniref:Protein-export membrane protein SecF n=1 Tax=Candidatus Endobugula sertula TaxID=62101 RepID=A0A1D2QNN7_9GAMM|nr:protein-export membrane protein SecF [Candidatus Endobugula sertula]